MSKSLYIKLLKDSLRFKSVSTDSNFKDEIEDTVKWLDGVFSQNGFGVKVVRGYGNPIVVAEYLFDKKKPTCLIYGHYDVQPAGVSDGWSSDPFTLSEKNGRLYGRGVVDNKGQILVHAVNVFELMKGGQLGVNVKFMIEGDEETGSGRMEDFVGENKQLLKCDFCLISDGEMNIKTPNVEAGFRGGFNSTLTITTSETDLHSGIYGGAVPSAAHEMVKFLATIFDDNNGVAVEGFYDGVDEITPEIRLSNAAIPFDEKEYLSIAGVRRLTMERGITDVVSQTGLRPSIQVTGIQTGYVGEGYRNSMPGKAIAKINFRLVKSQKYGDVAAAFEKHLKKHLPDTVNFAFKTENPYEGIKLDLSGSQVQRAKKILEDIYKEKVVFKYSGGGLPIATLINQILKVPCVLIPLANEDCRMHAVDENYDLTYLDKAMEFSKKFLSREGT